MDVERILAEVLRRVKPTRKELEQIRRAAEEIVQRLEGKGKYRRVVVAGSAARNTNLRGSSDLDVFLIYPRDVPREEMEKEVLRIGAEVLENPETRYAEHPYVHGTFLGVPVDLVPAYEMRKGERIKSATDRTPLHQEYVASRCKGKLCDEVRLLKAFLKGIGVYGAEISVRGFSGYLAELLVLHYGSFLDVLRAASKWKPPVHVPVARAAVRFKDPLIVPDPVDPYRNVAAPVSLDSLATFVAASRAFLERPSLVFFFPPDPTLSPSDVRRILSLRPVLVALFSYPPDASPDIFWGELRHMASRIVRAFERMGYGVLYADVWTDEAKSSALAVEIESTPASIYEKHEGPPVFNEEHSRRFLSKHADATFGPWIEGGRWYVLRPREAPSPAVALLRTLEAYRESSAKEPLRSALSNVEIVFGRAIMSKYVSDPAFARWFSAFLVRKPSWL